METVFTLLGRELRRRGIKVRFVLTQPAINSEWEETLGEVCHIIEDVSLPRGLDNRSSYKMLSHRTEKFYDQSEKPDVVLVASSGLIDAVRHGVGVDSTILAWPHSNLSRNFGTDEAMEIESHIEADALVAISPSIQSQSIRRHPDLPTFMIGNPVVLDVNEIPRADTVPAFIYLGRISGEKRIDWLLKAFARLKNQSWSLKIIGSGELEKQLQQLASQLHLNGRVQWIPFHPDPWNFVNEGTALLLASEYEGFGMVLVEALARGLPVISTDCPVGPSDIIRDGENGYLIGTEDFEGLVETLEDVITGMLPLPNPKTCRNSVRQYDVRLVVDRLLQAIDSARCAPQFSTSARNSDFEERPIDISMK